MIKVEYYVLNNNMSDEEFNNAPTRELVITKEMIMDLIRDKEELFLDDGDFVDSDNIYVKLK
jgi:hypothetical protein